MSGAPGRIVATFEDQHRPAIDDTSNNHDCARRHNNHDDGDDDCPSIRPLPFYRSSPEIIETKTNPHWNHSNHRRVPDENVVHIRRTFYVGGYALDGCGGCYPNSHGSSTGSDWDMLLSGPTTD